MNVYFLLVQTVDLSPSFLPFPVGFLYIFLYFTFHSFTLSSILQPYATNSVSILITSVLNCASNRWAISLSLSYVFSGALICSFIWVIFFFWSRCTCYVVRGGALGVHQGGATCTVLWGCVGEGLRGNSATCLALCQLSVTFPATHKQIGPFQCWFLGGWVCEHCRTLWTSPTDFPVRLRVSPLP